MGQGELFEDEGGEERQRVNLEMIEAWLRGSGASPLWWDGYCFLRAKGVRYRDAMLATWLSLGTDDRGEVRTRDDFARLMGVARATTYEWEAKRPVRTWAEVLQVMRLRGCRLAEVDEVTYRAAVGEKTTSARDRQLYYQRAGVWQEDVNLRLRGDREEPVQYVDVTQDELEAIREALKREAESSGEEG